MFKTALLIVHLPLCPVRFIQHRRLANAARCNQKHAMVLIQRSTYCTWTQWGPNKLDHFSDNAFTGHTDGLNVLADVA